MREAIEWRNSLRAGPCGWIFRDLRKHEPYSALHLADRLLVAGQMLEQTVLKQPIDHRVDDRRRHGLGFSGQFREATHDAPDHGLEALVQLGDVRAERRLEQRL